ncbi:hypothetical protein SAMN04487991_2613 [Celeribacter neptunius]|uniref:Uncharacterized protein n=1 Tax=Celeribacter neptunius TaxID=588602 RepID=A0A1I3T7K4_9RHOB|nr:hypothetical protein SAMN04487991_2613 [Celeribacter neptunius]
MLVYLVRETRYQRCEPKIAIDQKSGIVSGIGYVRAFGDAEVSMIEQQTHCGIHAFAAFDGGQKRSIFIRFFVSDVGVREWVAGILRELILIGSVYLPDPSDSNQGLKRPPNADTRYRQKHVEFRKRKRPCGRNRMGRLQNTITKIWAIVCTPCSGGLNSTQPTVNIHYTLPSHHRRGQTTSPST